MPVISASLANDTGPQGTTNTDGVTSDPTVAGTIVDASNITAFRVSAKVKDFGVGEHETLNLMLEHWNNGEKCSPPLEHEELQTTVESAYKTGFLPPGAASPDHDFADTPENRARVIELVRNSHTLFCEATFCEAESDQAKRTAHITTRACAEIAETAGVARLVPFHFSRRYEKAPAAVYAEIAAISRAVVVPETVVID